MWKLGCPPSLHTSIKHFIQFGTQFQNMTLILSSMNLTSHWLLWCPCNVGGVCVCGFFFNFLLFKNILDIFIMTGTLNTVCRASSPWYKFLFYFNRRLITFQYCGGFCHTFTWISHGFTCVPHPDPPSYLPPPPIPQRHPSTPDLSTLPHALNVDWRSISYMIIYMFQCYSLKSSHPHLLPQSPKVCCLYLCLFCSHIGSLLPSF